jgi:hypothetical protein
MEATAGSVGSYLERVNNGVDRARKSKYQSYESP